VKLAAFLLLHAKRYSAIRGLSKDLPSLPALNHRDISLTNILLSDREWKSKPLSDVAFITDLDNADYYIAGGGSMRTNDKLKGKVDAAGDSKVEHLHCTVSPTCHITYRHPNFI
jgi:hypothetical protein